MTVTPAILAINAGSSTVKCALFSCGREPEMRARTTLRVTGNAAAGALMEWIEHRGGEAPPVAIGHRIVHGGPQRREPQWVDESVLGDLRTLIPFAPNHLPEELALIEAFQKHDSRVPQLVCFDTAFHSAMPEAATRLPLPDHYHRRGIRRYGFHGLSYSYLVEELERLAGREAAAGRVILAHLGNGASLAAVREGKSVDTTMAFTPIGGVIMGTRSGDLDPGVVTYLGRNEGMSPDAIEALLSQHSGLLAISDTTSDMEELLAHEAGDARCRLAIEMFIGSVAKAIGALATVLRGVDVLVFSGGIGEHAPVIRARVCERLAFLGVELDAAANDSNGAVISTGCVEVRVIPTNEELMIARSAYRLLAQRGQR